MKNTNTKIEAFSIPEKGSSIIKKYMEEIFAELADGKDERSKIVNKYILHHSKIVDSQISPAPRPLPRVNKTLPMPQGTLTHEVNGSVLIEAFAKLGGHIEKQHMYAMFAWSFFGEAPHGLTNELFRYVKKEVFTREDFRKYKRITWRKPFCGSGSEIWVELMNYTIQKAMEGHSQIRESVLYIYKQIYKREYNTLKKFTALSASELMNLMQEYEGDPAQELFALSRILVISELRGTRHEGLELFYEIFNHLYRQDGGAKFDGLFSYEPICPDIISTYENKTLSESLSEDEDALERIMDIACVMLNHNGLPDHLLMLKADQYFAADYYRDVAIPKYTSVLAAYNPDQYSNTEWLAAVVIGEVVESISHIMTASRDDDFFITGIEGELTDEGLARIWDKIPAQKPSPGAVSTENLRLSKEIEALKHQLQMKEQELANEKEKSKVLEKTLKTESWKLEQLEKAMDAAGEETEEELSAEKEDAPAAPMKTSADLIPPEQKIEALRRKKVVIIGGNQNWIKKISGEEYFPDWTYVAKRVSGAVSDSVITSADHVVFFTDSLSHAVFYRFSKIVQNNNIPYSYLHGVNMDRVIQTLFAEIYEKGVMV